MMERSFICEIWQERVCQISFGYHIYQIPPWQKKVLYSLIYPCIKKYDFSDAQKFIVNHYANGSTQIQRIDFYQYYRPVAHAE